MKIWEYMQLFLTLLLISCSPYKKFVRTSSDFISICTNIDTITVISDALVGPVNSEIGDTKIIREISFHR